MSSPDAFTAVSAVLANWTATPVVFENEDYHVADSPTAFVYVEVFDDVMAQDTFGDPQANEWLEEGQIYLHVMVPAGTGTALARTHARDLLNLFREQPSNGVYFREMSIGAGDPGRRFGNYFATTLTIGWDRRDITSIA